LLLYIIVIISNAAYSLELNWIWFDMIYLLLSSELLCEQT